MTAPYTQLATRLARLAATATTQAEANHWWAETDRIAALADLAGTDPAAAQAAFRPVVAWTPEG